MHDQWCKGKERKSIYVAPFWPRWYTQSAQAWITQFYPQITPCLPFLRERSPDCTTTATEAADILLQLATHLSTRKDERLSWPSWLIYSGWFTHISGHPSATCRAQDSESTYRWTTQPTVVSVEPIGEDVTIRCRISSGQLDLPHGNHKEKNSGQRISTRDRIAGGIFHRENLMWHSTTVS